MQAIATHEIGHFTGLDHSGCIAATMFPFADTRSTTPRSLSSDDLAGVIAIYPLGTDNLGAITGFVERGSDNADISGAHVVAVNDDGVVVASTFSASNGSFLIDGLPADDYTVYAEPLDQPVQSSNLTSDLLVSTAFGTTFLGGATPIVLTVLASTTTGAGNIAVDDAHTHNLTTGGDNPYIAVRGGITSVLVVGEDLAATDTITVSGADVTNSSQMFLAMGALDGFLVNLTVGATAATGPRNLVLETAAGEWTFLSAGIEVLDSAPTVTGTTPASGGSFGGDTITVVGTGFQDGAIVILADQQATVLAVDSATQITVTTPALSPGTVRVQVQNPDGQLGQNASGFTVLADVSVDSVSPTAGSAGGGTVVTIAGNEFLSGASVTFGVVGATVTSVTSTEITCVAPPGAVGTVDVQVTNPDTTTDTLLGAFTYLADPDPSITTVDPSSGSTGGGTLVRITGSNFAAGASVFVDQATNGSGGTALTSVLVLDPNTIEGFTPSHAAGSFSITVTNPAGSSARLASAFTYVAPAPPSSGGGGGGCLAMVPVPAGSPPTPPGNGLPFIVLLGALVLAHSRTRRSIPSRARPHS